MRARLLLVVWQQKSRDWIFWRRGLRIERTIRRDSSSSERESMKKAKDTRNPTKSLISFTVDHRSPGALADVLDAFRKAKLNLTSINSRPTKVVPFQYIFFVEFEGSRLRDPDGRVEGALRGLEAHTQSWRWLGKLG